MEHGKMPRLRAECYPFGCRRILYVVMISALTVARRTLWRLRLFAATLAVVGQLGVFCAYVSLARDESSAISHTEQSGIDLHHGHNEATCAACTVLSFHAAVNPAERRPENPEPVVQSLVEIL